jgi:hypothetical protein
MFIVAGEALVSKEAPTQMQKVYGELHQPHLRTVGSRTVGGDH